MKTTQYHKTLIILYPFVLAILILLILFTIHQSPILSIVFCVVFILFFILTITYYKLTLSVNEDHVAFSFGIGWIKKKYNYNEIRSCKSVKGKFSVYSRVSFEKLPDGGTAYVFSSALPSIEITYIKKDGSICSDRVGTGKPDEITAYISKRIAIVNGLLDT